jgi:hypothetical protein
MNAIVIVADTLRRDHLPCYQEKVRPPWENLCPPYPIYAPHMTRLGQNSCLEDYETVLSETLNSSGIKTALFVDTPHPFAPAK